MSSKPVRGSVESVSIDGRAFSSGHTCGSDCFTKERFLRCAHHWIENNNSADTIYYRQLLAAHDPEAARLYVEASEAHARLTEHFKKHLEGNHDA